MSTNEEVNRKHRASTLSTLTDGHPVWGVLRDLLEETADFAVESNSKVGVTPDDRAFSCGYAACARDVLRELKELRLEGMGGDDA